MKDAKRWITAQQDKLDGITAEASIAFLESLEKDHEASFLKESLARDNAEFPKLTNLTGPVDYDSSITMPYTYAIRYHCRRINVFLSLFFDDIYTLLKKSVGQKIQIFDLGSGTGAVQWAVALILLALKECENIDSLISIINVDKSSSMLKFNKFIWEKFKKDYDNFNSIEVVFKEGDAFNFSNSSLKTTTNVLTASFLIGIEENIDKIFKNIIELMKKSSSTQLYFVTSYKKGENINQIKSSFEEAGYLFDNRYKYPKDLIYQEKTTTKMVWKDPGYRGFIVFLK